jgi:hypothetical protein
MRTQKNAGRQISDLQQYKLVDVYEDVRFRTGTVRF